MKISDSGIRGLFYFFFVSLIFAAFLLPAQVSYAESARLKLSEEVFVDQRDGKMWQFDRTKRIKNVEDAQQILASFNQGEYSDWRFPTKRELFDLFQVFDLKNNGDVKPRLEGKYWIVDEDGALKAASWEIGDGCGPSRTFYEGKAGYIRAVRNLP